MLSAVQSIGKPKTKLPQKNPQIVSLVLHYVLTKTTLEDIEEAFIYKDIPIKNLKRCTKIEGAPISLVMFDFVSLGDKSNLLKNGIAINNQNKVVRDYIN